MERRSGCLSAIVVVGAFERRSSSSSVELSGRMVWYFDERRKGKKRRMKEIDLRPISVLSSCPGIVSFNPKIARMSEQNRADALKIVGRAKGYVRIQATPCGS